MRSPSSFAKETNFLLIMIEGLHPRGAGVNLWWAELLPLMISTLFFSGQDMDPDDVN